MVIPHYTQPGILGATPSPTSRITSKDVHHYMFHPPYTADTHLPTQTHTLSSRRVSHSGKMSNRAYLPGPSSHSQEPSVNDFSEEERDLLPGEELTQNTYRPLLRAPSAMAVEEDTTSGLLLHQNCLMGFLMDDGNFSIARLQAYIYTHWGSHALVLSRNNQFYVIKFDTP